MYEGTALLVFVTLQRFGEFIWDRQNTARLMADGAVCESLRGSELIAVQQSRLEVLRFSLRQVDRPPRQADVTPLHSGRNRTGPALLPVLPGGGPDGAG
jgi:hypothetical protein